jgi:hypothetical protein
VVTIDCGPVSKLDAKPDATDEEIRITLGGVLCRCFAHGLRNQTAAYRPVHGLCVAVRAPQSEIACGITVQVSGQSRDLCSRVFD